MFSKLHLTLRFSGSRAVYLLRQPVFEPLHEWFKRRTHFWDHLLSRFSNQRHRLYAISIERLYAAFVRIKLKFPSATLDVYILSATRSDRIRRHREVAKPDSQSVYWASKLSRCPKSSARSSIFGSFMIAWQSTASFSIRELLIWSRS